MMSYQRIIRLALIIGAVLSLQVSVAATIVNKVVAGMQTSVAVDQLKDKTRLTFRANALIGNVYGFVVDGVIPSLTITALVTRDDLDKAHKNPAAYVLFPSLTPQGPAYQALIPLLPPGKYHLWYHIVAPSRKGFYHHIDKETGVPPYWAPLDIRADFALKPTT